MCKYNAFFANSTKIAHKNQIFYKKKDGFTNFPCFFCIFAPVEYVLNDSI